MGWRRSSLGWAMAMAMTTSSLAGPAADALHARHAALAIDLQDNAFGRPIQVTSTQAGSRLAGEVHAVLAHPFGRVRATLRQPGRWCELLVLPFNTLACREVAGATGPVLHLRVGRRPDQPLEQAFALALAFQPVADTADYFELRLGADEGPLGTRDLRIAVSAVPLPGGRSFLRLGYAYGFGLAGRVAMRAYLATAGAGKVGFSTEPGQGGPPVPVGGLRGAVERNAMRHYLAIDALLETLDALPGELPRRRLEAWFDAAERYPRQLHEMDKATYVALKEGAIARMRASGAW